jgi:hypothetical protein
MFDNPAFDVVIGMVLIYLLYSLLVSILGEVIATWVAMRSRILRVAIEKMLTDGYLNGSGNMQYSNWWHFIQRFFLKEFEGFKDSFAGKFYEQASIKYLSGKAGDKHTYFSQTKPSYISDSNFAHTLSGMLAEKGMGQTVMDKINYCLTHNICHIQPQTLAHIQRLFAAAGDDAELFAAKLKDWFNETNDRATGWYKRKLQLILFWLGFVIAVAFNVDSIKIARFLAKDEDARKDLATMAIAQAGDSLRYAAFINGSGDTLRNKSALDSGLALAKNDIKEANMILGLGWGLDTLTKNTQLFFTAKDDSAQYQALLHCNTVLNDTISAAAVKKANAAVLALRKKLALQKAKLEGIFAFINSATAQKAMADTVAKMAAALPDSQKVYLQDSMTLAQQQDSLVNINTIINSTFTTLHQLTDRKLVSISSIDSSKKGILVVQGKTTYNTIDKILYVIGQLPRSGTRLLGFIITALMLSLGAPFWFDLLKKLVALRGAGVKPEEKKAPVSTQNASKFFGDDTPSFAMPSAALFNTVSEDAGELAMESMTQQLKQEPGVAAVGLRPQPNTNPPEMAVEVMVKDANTLTRLQQQYGNSVKTPGGKAVPVVFNLSDPNTHHGAMIGSEIGNKTGVLGQGTLGCFLEKKGDTKKYFLSCWHVLKDNSQWNIAPLEKTILGSANQQIGTIVEGCLTDKTDVGIATYNLPIIDHNVQLTITGQQRALMTYDALVSTPVQLYGKVCGFKKAQVFHHKINVQLEYPDHLMHTMLDVFSISVKDAVSGKFTAPTSDGDSGAVVTDASGLPLGMIIGGNSTFSYAVKFTNIFNPGTPYADYSFITKT